MAAPHLYYHTVAEHGEPEDQVIVGFYIEDTIYADLYYGYGGPENPGPRRQARAGDRGAHRRLAPETVLVHVKAGPDVIRRRMREHPHTRPVVPEADVELVLDRFASAFAASNIANKLELDTGGATVAESVNA